MEIKQYAPVIIPTLNRYDHFKRCLESLEKCTGADKTDVFIGLDYPPSEKYVDGWKKIDEYLELKEKENRFKRLVVFRRDHNCGVLNENSNSSLLRKYVMDYYDRWIYSEDDNEFSPNFLEYQNQCLEVYKDDPNVVAVCGYTYPIEWMVSESATCLKENVCVSAFGVGYWKDKYELAAAYMKAGNLRNTLPKVVQAKLHKKMIDAALMGFFDNGTKPQMLIDTERNFFYLTTDVAMRCYLAVENKYAISPVISKVRNHGFDGSGSCCQAIEDANGNTAGTYNYTKQPIDTASTFELIEDTLHADEENRIRLNAFDYRSPEQMAKTYRLIWLCEHLGVWSAKLYCMLALPFEAVPYIIHKLRK